MKKELITGLLLSISPFVAAEDKWYVAPGVGTFSFGGSLENVSFPRETFSDDGNAYILELGRKWDEDRVGLIITQPQLSDDVQYIEAFANLEANDYVYMGASVGLVSWSGEDAGISYDFSGSSVGINIGVWWENVDFRYTYRMRNGNPDKFFIAEYGYEFDMRIDDVNQFSINYSFDIN